MANSLNVSANPIPFDQLIGSPLAACIEAQKQSANATLNFIKNSGLIDSQANTDKDEYDVATVVFSFEMEGKQRKLTVPILSIVPIPYMAIESVKINFRAEMSLDKENNLVGKFSSMNNVSAESSQSSKYNVQSQLDVEVIASGHDLPSGLSKVLNILEGTIKVDDLEDVDASKASDSLDEIEEVAKKKAEEEAKKKADESNSSALESTRDIKLRKR